MGLTMHSGLVPFDQPISRVWNYYAEMMHCIQITALIAFLWGISRAVRRPRRAAAADNLWAPPPTFVDRRGAPAPNLPAPPPPPPPIFGGPPPRFFWVGAPPPPIICRRAADTIVAG